MAASRPPEKGLAIWCAVYLLSLPFQAVWELPYVGSKVQPPELVFLAGIPLLYRQLPAPLEWGRAEKALLLLPVVMLGSVLAHPGLSGLFELLGLVYLYGVLLLFRALVQSPSWPEGAFTVFSCSLIVISVASFISATAGFDPEGFLSEWKWLPFLGQLPRISGTAPSSNLWASLLAFAGYYHWVYLRRKGGNPKLYFLLAGLGVSYLFTFSKSVFTAAGMLMLWDSKHWKYKKLIQACGFALILAGVTLTHWLPVSGAGRPENISYLPASDCMQFEKLHLCPTTYLLLKRKAVEAVTEHFWFGVGGGGFQQWLKQEKTAGRYPAETPAYDPHSTYFGITAETGVPGLLALLFAAYSVFGLKQPHQWLPQAAGLYIAYIGLEALSMDILNFRALWISLGVFIGLQTAHEKGDIT